MGFRFSRRIKILPGVTVNLSRSGISTSIGIKGAHITVGHGKVRETVGLPGTGLSYTETQGTHQEARSAAPPAEAPKHGAAYYVGVALFAVAIIWAIVATYRGQT